MLLFLGPIFFGGVLVRFSASSTPLVTKRPKTRLKKTEQNNRGRRKKRREKSHIFCDEARWIFFKQNSCF
jgi:hypothetical protein